jgi:hypothetical protein
MHYGNFAYKLFFLLHLLCVVVGFGSTFVWAALMPRVRKLPPEASLEMSKTVFLLAKRLTTPFTWAAGAFGIGLVILSDKFIKFSDAWISIGFTLFVIGALVAMFVLLPANKKMIDLQEELVAAAPPAGGGAPPQVAELDATGKRVAAVGGFLHLIFLLLMIDMVWGSFHAHAF